MPQSLNGQDSAPLGPQRHGEETASIFIRVSNFFSSGADFTEYITIFQWYGYREFRKEIHTIDNARVTITVSKFAQHIGQAVDAFFMVSLPSALIEDTCTELVTFIPAVRRTRC
jgi:hypothetical protein